MMAEIIYHIGIDPGKKYACAIMRTMRNSKTTITLTDTLENTTNALRGVLSTIKDLSCINAWIEDVGAMAYAKTDKHTGKKTFHSQKGKSNFGFGFDTGFVHGMFAAYDIQLNKVSPRTWLKEFKIPSRSKPSDIPYFAIAKDMFPQFKDTHLKYKTKHHDNAAALLIAEYGRRCRFGRLEGGKVKRIETVYDFMK